MALALPPQIQNLMNQGNGLLAKFNQQGLAIHQIAFRQKEVGAKIEDMIAKFETHEVMKKPRDTIAILQEVKSSFKVIQTNIKSLAVKEKQMSNLIQAIIVRQRQGNVVSGRIHAQITHSQKRLNAIQDQINVTQSRLHTVAAELEQLQKRIDMMRKNRMPHRTKRFWVFAAVLVVGLAGAGVYKGMKAAKAAREHRRQIYTKLENNFKNLQGSFERNVARKGTLERNLQQRQFELDEIGNILNRLQPSLHDTVKYRNYLLKLSDDFRQVNSYVQNLEKNLRTLLLVQAAGHYPDGSMNVTISNGYKNLNDAWNTAKMKPAIKVSLSLQDPNNSEATLTAIKSLDLTGRKKRSHDLEKPLSNAASDRHRG